MNNREHCEYCSRPIVRTPTIKTLKGQKQTFCSEFCFRLYFYDVPTISYDDLKKMYELRCVTMHAPDFHTLINEEEA